MSLSLIALGPVSMPINVIRWDSFHLSKYLIFDVSMYLSVYVSICLSKGFAVHDGRARKHIRACARAPARAHGIAQAMARTHGPARTGTPRRIPARDREGRASSRGGRARRILARLAAVLPEAVDGRPCVVASSPGAAGAGGQQAHLAAVLPVGRMRPTMGLPLGGHVG